MRRSGFAGQLESGDRLFSGHGGERVQALDRFAGRARVRRIEEPEAGDEQERPSAVRGGFRRVPVLTRIIHEG